MQFSLYSLTSPNLKLWTFVASLRSTGPFYQSLGIRACYNDVAFVSGIHAHPYILETTLETAEIFRQIEQ